jgi:hypothetical protein
MKRITRWLINAKAAKTKFESAYGAVTNHQWLSHELDRVGGEIRTKGRYISLWRGKNNG